MSYYNDEGSVEEQSFGIGDEFSDDELEPLEEPGKDDFDLDEEDPDRDH